MDYQRLQVTYNNGITHVMLNYPQKLNAFDIKMFNELKHISKRLKHCKTTKVVIISGANGNFSSGLDFSDFMKNKHAILKLLFKVFKRMPNLA